jgi:hypothetical protein
VNSRYSILRGQKPNASHLGALQQADATLRNVCSTLTTNLRIERLSLTLNDRNCLSSQTPTSTTHFALQMLRRASGLTRTLHWRRSSRYSYLDDEHHGYRKRSIHLFRLQPHLLHDTHHMRYESPRRLRFPVVPLLLLCSTALLPLQFTHVSRLATTPLRFIITRMPPNAPFLYPSNNSAGHCSIFDEGILVYPFFFHSGIVTSSVGVGVCASVARCGQPLLFGKA